MNSFDVYQRYIALKNHFTSSYDYFKYQGKVRASVSSFQTRKDLYQFQRLAKLKDPEKVILANMIEVGPDIWIGDINEEVYRSWLKRQESITYIFSQDLNHLLPDFNDNIRVDKGYPYLLKLYYSKYISLETLVIICSLFNILPYWNKNISKKVENIIWPRDYNLIMKYTPFVKYDRKKIIKIVKDKYGSNYSTKGNLRDKASKAARADVL